MSKITCTAHHFDSFDKFEAEISIRAKNWRSYLDWILGQSYQKINFWGKISYPGGCATGPMQTCPTRVHLCIFFIKHIQWASFMCFVKRWTMAEQVYGADLFHDSSNLIFAFDFNFNGEHSRLFSTPPILNLHNFEIIFDLISILRHDFLNMHTLRLGELG